MFSGGGPEPASVRHVGDTCLHFAWRTTSLRVGGRAARHSCLPGLCCGGGRQAGATVLSCLMWWCELSRPDKCVRRSHCAAQHTPTQTRHRTHLSGGRADSIHTATPDTTKQSCLCRVWRGGVKKLLQTRHGVRESSKYFCFEYSLMLTLHCS